MAWGARNLISTQVDGEEIKYFPPNIKARRNLIAWTVILVASTAVMALVIATFFLKAILAVRNNLLNTRHWNCEKNQRQFSGSPKCVKNYGIPRWLGIDMSGEIGNTLVSLAQAAQIFALENVFNELALFLNRYENHATDTEFTDKLTEKVFIFQGINLCINQIVVTRPPRLNHDLHAIDATPARWRAPGVCHRSIRSERSRFRRGRTW